MKGNSLMYALQFVTGAMIIQMLILAVPAQFAALPLPGIAPGILGNPLNVQSLTAVQALLFLIFDIAGGLGFIALVNKNGGDLFQSGV
ncbi:hypothetical protein FGU65_01915 [Methanoculleus sp. FWC-SCC1]|uniref:Uncharacterized protein n=1 Tax=Methanoculleus frigidifontis TaxID=2584085 RepID=A0ABT8M6W1_9EURY|nr:hypothetical protein [Methanoculleus sp. FWC-SCC1]MDN7023665.1 hypothetical protein [Methanoculleus sp. FWC-SCC1]